MNISQVGIVASAAATPLAQTRGNEVDRVRQETAVHERTAEATTEAESAEGIGTTNEEQATGERDADGRRPWEIDQQGKRSDNETAELPGSRRPKDPSGLAGSQLDLSG
jgi:hypothetical protein